MKFYPNDTLEKLEFDKIIQLLHPYCYGEQARQIISKLQPSKDFKAIQILLNETDEYAHSQQLESPPLQPYQDISPILEQLAIIDFVLAESSILRIKQQLTTTKGIFHYFSKTKKESYPNLARHLLNIQYETSLLQAIQKIMDEEGNIKGNASPALGGIRKAINSKNTELDKAFRALITKYRNQDYLSDTIETFRNQRRVLSIKSQYKRQIRGIIHDESTTGQTAYIEPDPIIEINNDIFELHTEEKKEIYKLLKDLCNTLRPFIDQLQAYQRLIVNLDVIQARASLAQKMQGIKPTLLHTPTLGIQFGRHPLLFLKLLNESTEVVPFDLKLNKPNRLLIVSGPNAGGKSILMKAVGLMQIMVQSGLLIPCDETSEFGVFDKLFTDIGDQQSLEDDLSTYSSRLKNAKEFLQQTDDKTMILIDEFGSGTDPKIGGAIAQAILDKLNHKKPFGIVTTHYSNLKVYAFKTIGLVNGSMLFDKDNLNPTFQLKIGQPGSSFAFEIAQKIGFPKSLLNYARKLTGKRQSAIDELLIDLQTQLNEAKSERKQLKEKQSKLQKLISNYQQLHTDLTYQRKKIKVERKEAELASISESNKELENLIRKLREEKKLEQAKQLSKKVKEQRKQTIENISSLNQEIFDSQTFKKSDQTIKIGNFAKLRNSGTIGEVESITKNKAVILSGQLRLEVKLSDLIPANTPLNINKTKSIQTTSKEPTGGFNPKLDIRGMRHEEALQTLEVFVDQALLSGVSSINIVHGKGTGALRKVVRQKLREYKGISNYYHPESHLGGDGLTIVEFEQ